uniref:Uncharacterized protein n=1 Tax=Hemiselmis tepida TaxID=464990 RepID=A0A6T6XVM6_9CRYP|mmetsp:Transcript_7126/g.18117  ORF Transcript_7126/g.18117 Transcript_7126/m.18117 type:complete len:214 (+) Transcript_7126:452-1093(+)
MVNIGPLQTLLARICASLVIAGFLIRPATGCCVHLGNQWGMHALEQCSNDLTFEPQAPMVDLSACGCGSTSGEWLPATMDGAARKKANMKDLRSHTLPPSVCKGADGRVYLPVVEARRSINSLVDLALHPTAEISHGCPKRYHDGPRRFNLLERLYQAIRSPVARLSEQQTVLDPSRPPLAPEAAQGRGRTPSVVRLDEHQCPHHPPPQLRPA